MGFMDINFAGDCLSIFKLKDGRCKKEKKNYVRTDSICVIVLPRHVESHANRPVMFDSSFQRELLKPSEWHQ